MYNDFYDHAFTGGTQVDSTWILVSLVLAIVGGIVAYVMFVSKKNNGEYTGKVAWLHDFLNFKVFIIDVILKVLYLIIAIFITLSSISFIPVSIALFFVWLIFGNLVARIGYEFVLLFLTLVDNTTQINKKLTAIKKETANNKKSTTDKKNENA